uniref:Uncharacterized protein n=1 Tax=Anguilla anguilla TaxID=7936 RepID=A0A0E9R356_ANGAN
MTELQHKNCRNIHIKENSCSAISNSFSVLSLKKLGFLLLGKQRRKKVKGPTDNWSSDFYIYFYTNEGISYSDTIQYL